MIDVTKQTRNALCNPEPNNILINKDPIKKGLYAILYMNNTKYPIRDNNTDKKTGLPGKTVILPNCFSIKHGKFEGGHLKRRKMDYDHLKIATGPSAGMNYFCEALLSDHVLDLSKNSNPQVRIKESAWNRYIKNWIKVHGYIMGNNFQGDWRKFSCDKKNLDPIAIYESLIKDLSKLKWDSATNSFI